MSQVAFNDCFFLRRKAAPLLGRYTHSYTHTSGTEPGGLRTRASQSVIDQCAINSSL